MRKLQESEEHRRRISETLRGKRKVCSLCGGEGHNRRGCPQNPSNQARLHPEVQLKLALAWYI